jgi:hypothetical protein
MTKANSASKNDLPLGTVRQLIGGIDTEFDSRKSRVSCFVVWVAGT